MGEENGYGEKSAKEENGDGEKGVFDVKAIPIPFALFQLGNQVSLHLSGERGYVRGIARYEDQPDSFYVVYVAADGRQVSDWFPASQLNLQDVPF